LPKDGESLPESKILRRQPDAVTKDGADQDAEDGQGAHRRLRLRAKPEFYRDDLPAVVGPKVFQSSSEEVSGRDRVDRSSQNGFGATTSKGPAR
jgi:hypothetical protein